MHDVLSSMFAKRLKELRKQEGVTQLQLAKAIGVVESTIGHYESGRNEPSIEILKKIAKFFDITMDDLTNMDSE